MKSINSKLYNCNLSTFYDGNTKITVLVLPRLCTLILWRRRPDIGKCRNFMLYMYEYLCRSICLCVSRVYLCALLMNEHVLIHNTHTYTYTHSHTRASVGIYISTKINFILKFEYSGKTKKIKQKRIYDFMCQIASLFNLTVSREGRYSVAHRYSNLPPSRGSCFLL
jgi:hypothetical protein